MNRRGWARWALAACIAALAACGGGGGSGAGGASNAPASTPQAPTITQAPQPVSAVVGSTASFSVTADGTAPLSYQWLRNGVAIDGATASTYTTPAVAPADDGAGFSVRVSNAVDAVTSAAATLTVTGTGAAASGPRIMMSAAGHALAVRADGSVIAWGNGGAMAVLSAPPLAGSAARIVGVDQAVAALGGLNEDLVLRADGSVRGWGSRVNGWSMRGGAGSAAGIETAPTPVAAAFPTGVSSLVVAQNLMAFALRSDGTVWQMPGTITTTGIGTVRVDGRVVAGLDQVVSLSAGAGGAGRAAAVRADGSVWTLTVTAFNPSGDIPVTVSQVGGLPAVAKVSCGPLHCLALARDGTVWAWGSNLFAQLGDGSTSDRAAPARVAGLADVVAVAASAVSSLAITADGQLWTWGGSDLSGIAGVVSNLSAPTAVPGVTDAVQVSAGNAVLVLRRDGSLSAWGSNLQGELGSAVGPSARTPVTVPGINLN